MYQSGTVPSRSGTNDAEVDEKNQDLTVRENPGKRGGLSSRIIPPDFSKVNGKQNSQQDKADEKGTCFQIYAQHDRAKCQ
ncbi:MAG TPA: hypothetical protein VH413_07325 [Verrucomicrobiae bacterium]|nr:hypothetical protein [Verrucomicrobiae bacterium]